jgi:hypothetical protein
LPCQESSALQCTAQSKYPLKAGAPYNPYNRIKLQNPRSDRRSRAPLPRRPERRLGLVQAVGPRRRSGRVRARATSPGCMGGPSRTQIGGLISAPGQPLRRQRTPRSAAGARCNRAAGRAAWCPTCETARARGRGACYPAGASRRSRAICAGDRGRGSPKRSPARAPSANRLASRRTAQPLKHPFTDAPVWRFRSPRHSRGESRMRTSEPSHTRSISCQCPSLPKFANEGAA